MGRVDRRAVEVQVEAMALPLAREQGLELVDVEYVRQQGRNFLRVYLHKPGGLTLDDCQTFSRALGARLDAADPVPESYYLEVSSPGLDRILRREREYEIFRGRRVQVRTTAPVDGRTVFGGALEGREDGCVVVVEEDGTRRTIPLELVSQTRLDEVW
ncbi:MAG: ribosome maturation factor RimP [Clostridia bacterium]|nr:ribosome maturation factor RimP [Clostridia bacterium]